jgi:hypothetical protein
MKYDAYEILENNIIFYSETGQTRLFPREEELGSYPNRSKDVP